jgi:hypothetical protein
MPSLVRTLAAPALLAIAVCVSPGALADYRSELHLTDVEIAQLPRFCWAQMGVPNAVGPGYGMESCGPRGNHYCPGLVYLLRAKNPSKYGKPLPLLQHADVDVRYTEDGIKDYPACSIRSHVAATRVEINNLLRIYGGKPVPPGQ